MLTLLRRPFNIFKVGNAIQEKCVGETHRLVATMPNQAAFLEKYRNTQLKIKPSPDLGALEGDQLRIGVGYCALNNYDFQYIAGHAAVDLPFIPGSELTGVVLELGPNCTGKHKVGDRVVALPSNKHLGGGIASECFVSENECHSIGGLSLEEAATLVHSYGSALLAFSNIHEMRQNEKIVVLAGVGGDGLAGIEIVRKLYKAHVSAVLDTTNTMEIITEGEDLVNGLAINGKVGPSQLYKAIDGGFKKKIKVIYDGIGCSMIHLLSDFIDSTGVYITTDPLFSPEYFADVKPNFKRVTQKHAKRNKENPAIAPDSLLSYVKQTNLMHLQLQDPILFNQILAQVYDLYTKKTIDPIYKVFNLTEINKAILYATNRKSLGKILIKVGTHE